MPIIQHLPVARAEAQKRFVEIDQNEHTRPVIGRARSLEEELTCECMDDYYRPGDVCGYDSNCINRIMQIECMADCSGCHSSCQNQRLQKRQYLSCEVVKTENRGFALRAEECATRDTLIYEYIGEIIDRGLLERRMENYTREGLKDFYFMKLQKNQFIDATKRAGIGRFANHSCNPNCYVSQWVVGQEVRMGIYAKRDIVKYEEITFGYNADIYGIQPQACHCGELNCTGFIGKAQGIMSRRMANISAIRALTIDQVPALLQEMRRVENREELVKSLNRLKVTTDPETLRQVMRARVFSLMKNILEYYLDETDEDVLSLALQCMHGMPLKNKNKVEDSKISVSVRICLSVKRLEVREWAKKLLSHWESLEIAYRIPRKVGAFAAAVTPFVSVPSLEKDGDAESERQSEWVRKHSGLSTQQLTWDQVQLKIAIMRAERCSEEEAEARAVALRPVQLRRPPSPDWEELEKSEKAKEKAGVAQIIAAAVGKRQRLEMNWSSQEEKLRRLVGTVVVNTMSKRLSKIDTELFKKHAKHVTEVICEREKQSTMYKENRLDNLPPNKAAKMEQYIIEYTDNIAASMSLKQ